jgi:hypothetical protein
MTATCACHASNMTSTVNSTAASRWVPVARETFEECMVPWIGRKYVPWLRACTRAYPLDPDGQVLVPERIYRAFGSTHALSEHVTDQQLADMRYPRLSAEDELDELREALHAAEFRADMVAVASLASRIETLQEQTSETRHSLGL